VQYCPFAGIHIDVLLPHRLHHAIITLGSESFECTCARLTEHCQWYQLQCFDMIHPSRSLPYAQAFITTYICSGVDTMTTSIVGIINYDWLNDVVLIVLTCAGYTAMCISNCCG
jgi:hypothetical protein